MAMFSSPMWRPNASCIEFQVSEPFSRTMNGSRARRDTGMRFLDASGWSGAATIT